MTRHPLTTLPLLDAVAAFMGAYDSAAVEGVPHPGANTDGSIVWEADDTTVVFDLTDPATLTGLDAGTATVLVEGHAVTGPVIITDPYGPWDRFNAAGVADAVKSLVIDTLARDHLPA